MAFRILDIRCPSCLTVRENEALEREAPFPACECGGTFQTYWGGKHDERKADNFTPRTMDDRHFATKSEWDAHIAGFEANTGMKVVDCEANTKARKMARADEIRHRHYNELKKKGIDYKDYLASQGKRR